MVKNMIINLTTKEVRELSSHPHVNWMGEGWVVVPLELENKVRSLVPHCKLRRNRYGEIVDVTEDNDARFPQLQAQKVVELSDARDNAIYGGITVDGKHYTLKMDDQFAIKSWADRARLGASVPYHSDSPTALCEVYSPGAFLEIATAAEEHVTYHMTYFNHLKVWALRAEVVGELAGITYGAQLPADLAQNMANVLAGGTAPGVEENV